MIQNYALIENSSWKVEFRFMGLDETFITEGIKSKTERQKYAWYVYTYVKAAFVLYSLQKYLNVLLITG